MAFALQTLVQETSTEAVSDKSTSQPNAAVDLYFIQDDGEMFRATMSYRPYFYIATRSGKEAEVEDWLQRRFEGLFFKSERVFKEDLQLVRSQDITTF